jgi:colicin import membrane protein
MAKTHLEPLPISDRSSDHSDGGGRVWKWVFLSGFAHVIFIAALLIMPFLPNKAPYYPVYTIDLVGGEKLGGGAGTALAPAPKSKPVPEVKAAPEVKETRKEPKAKKTKEEPPARTQLAKESVKKAADKRATEMAELASAKAKKEAEEAEAEKTRERLKQLREKRIEEALADVKNRAQREEKAQQQQQQQQKAGPATSNVVGDKPGAAAPGVGGTGGGIVRSVESIRYENDMKARIKNSWTWPGKRNDLTVTVRFSIRDNGEIAGLKITRSSGDHSYDESVMRALKGANPLPALPEKLRDELKDWELDFNSKELAS